MQHSVGIVGFNRHQSFQYDLGGGGGGVNALLR